MNEMYVEKRVEDIKNVLKKDLGFYELVFQKEVAEDLYSTAYDSKGIEDRVRVKPQLGTVYTWVQGKWGPVKGYKIK
ncbi:hypothetical protein [Cytobacillus oceanisediminis]|uniref:hypothetical protein n=1 Tax=Cytobacillus oceanisediminis TaxID=665099 RepID=UPI001FB21832|nr:hypothetical protein [Cytobacillus oceanisediminis]UOE55108.1 hypothetical protein IRB79_25620 [Cytobacillus oceanisediminis]